jgi:hypothetical protein
MEKAYTWRVNPHRQLKALPGNHYRILSDDIIATSRAIYQMLNRAESSELPRLHIPSEAHHAQSGYPIPVRVKLIPGQAVTRRLWMSVVVIVPTLAKSEQSHPKAVARGISRRKPARTPHVRGRVHKPCRMQSENSPEKDAPQQERPPADGEEAYTKNRYWHPVPAADPHMKFVFAKIGNVG